MIPWKMFVQNVYNWKTQLKYEPRTIYGISVYKANSYWFSIIILCSVTCPKKCTTLPFSVNLSVRCRSTALLLNVHTCSHRSS